MNRQIYKQIANDIQKGTRVCMMRKLYGREGSIEGEHATYWVEEAKEDDASQPSLRYGMPTCTCNGDQYEIAEPFYPEERLIVLGGGHIAIPLVEFAAKTGFIVTVVDDRPSFANAARFPWAKQVICDRFDSALDKLQIKRNDYVVIITRGHRHDRDCLHQICMQEEPQYVGMIGSKRRTSIVIDSLIEEGCDEERLQRVHTPIGLSIGAITPEEIAISILSELICVKRLKQADLRRSNCSDMDYDVLQVLAEETDVPKVTITVIETKGSVPRGAGAKMIVYADGRMKGSIGGGCSEAAVVTDARRMIGTKTYRMVDIDMTGEAAEDEGMVCGGIMTVLIEDYMTTEER